MLEFYNPLQCRKYLSLAAVTIVAENTVAHLLRMITLACSTFLLIGAFITSSATAQTKVTVDILDKATGNRVPARVEYTQPAGRGPKPRKSLTAGRHTLFEQDNLLLPGAGAYEFTVRRGPEFQDVKAGFTVERNSLDSFEVVVPHKTPMRLFGWYSGDLLSRLPPSDLKRWMAAESLDIAATTHERDSGLPPAKSNPDANPNTIESGSANTNLMIRPSSAPLNSKGEPDWTTTPSPSPLAHVVSNSKQVDIPDFGGIVFHHDTTTEDNSIDSENWILQLDTPNVHAELTRPWDRHVPLILASDNIDSVQLLSEHLQPERASPLSPTIRNPDTLRFKGKKGLGRLAEYLYWQILEAGFRIPLTAGSGFNTKGDTTLGYNRVYAFLEPSMTPNPVAWWQQVQRGATIVTNGPLMVPTINGLPPGSIQVGYRDQPIQLDIELDLTVRDPVEYLEVVFNGQSLYQARLEEHALRGTFPPLAITESGWLILRVVTEHEQSYRMTTTSPYYFDFENRRVSRKAVRFFQDWLDESEKIILRDTQIANRYGTLLEKAKRFWSNQMDQSTVD